MDNAFICTWTQCQYIFFYGVHSLDLNDSSLMMVTLQPFIQYQNSMETMKTFDFWWWLKWKGPILCILNDKNLLQSLTNRVLHTWHRRQRKILFPENYREPQNMTINCGFQKKSSMGQNTFFIWSANNWTMEIGRLLTQRHNLSGW